MIQAKVPCGGLPLILHPFFLPSTLRPCTMSLRPYWANVIQPETPYTRELTYALSITNAAAVFGEKETAARSLFVKVDDSELIAVCRLTPQNPFASIQIQLAPGANISLSAKGGKIDIIGFQDLQLNHFGCDSDHEDEFGSEEVDSEEEEEIAPPTKKQKTEAPKKPEAPKKIAEAPKKVVEAPKKVVEAPKKAGPQLVNKTLANGLQIQDITAGTGKTPVKGRRVVIKYKGMLAKNGRKFDQSANFAFTYGIGEVVKGMDLGVEGMKEGGKRRIVIPSALGYGKRGAGKDIPPNADLIFDLELCRAG
eukprot:TRINITY_DN2959_c0_g1_i1.p2 TRINITY_DN2959_c0_g1~~TRINITY_DN2959_c0_g1_i1.p2  ORF type:complete len:308 (-),score=166.26 TRINITY_DN2959_c0_g1_i1:130-1053(-)